MKDIQADHDQWQAVKRDWAAGCREILDECIRVGFDRDEAMDLLLRWLDGMGRLECSCDS